MKHDLPIMTAEKIRQGNLDGRGVLSAAAWLRVLEEVFLVDISSKLDSIDISWPSLNWALEGMEDRQVFALESRYNHRLTLEGVGKAIGRRDGTGPVSKEIARLAINRAVRMLRHQNRIRVIHAAIVAPWNLETRTFSSKLSWS